MLLVNIRIQSLALKSKLYNNHISLEYPQRYAKNSGVQDSDKIIHIDPSVYFFIQSEISLARLGCINVKIEVCN